MRLVKALQRIGFPTAMKLFLKSHIPHPVLAYGAAIAFTAIALWLTLSLERFMIRTVGVFFSIAVIVSSWYGGFRPGLVGVFLSISAIYYYFIPPLRQFGVVSTDDVMQLAIFSSVALLMNIITANLQDSKRRIEHLSQRLQIENTERLQTALNAAQIGMWDWDLVTGKICWSPEHEQLFNLAPGSFNGSYEMFDAHLHPDDRSGLQQAIQESLNNRTPYHYEYRILWADSSLHWLEGRGRAFYNETGQAIRMSGTILAIDERKQVEEALRQSETRLRLAQVASNSGVWDWDLQTNTLFWSPEYYRLYGLELSIKPSYENWLDSIHPDDRKRVRQHLLQAQDHHQTDLRVEFRAIRFGEVRWFAGIGQIFRNATGQPIRMIGITLDITQEKQIENVLQELNAQLEQKVTERTAELTAANNRLLEAFSEQQQTQHLLFEQAQLLDLAHDTILTCDLSWAITFWNQGAQRMYGWNREEALGKKSYNLLKTEFPQRFAEIQAELFDRGYWEGELVHRSQDGRFLTVATRWVLHKDDLGQPIKILEINNDVTARKEAEKALQQYVTEVEDLYNHAPCGYHSLDAEGTLIRINDTELQWLGYSREEILYQRKFFDLMTRESRQVFERNFPRFKEQGWVNNLEFQLLCKDGTSRWVSLNSTAIRDASGEFVMSRSTLFDISDRKQAEQERLQVEIALRESEETFRSLSEFSPIGIFLSDRDGNCIYTNPRFQSIVGCTVEEGLGKGWFDFIYPDDRTWASQYWFDIVASGQEGMMNDLRYQNRQGRICYTQLRMAPIKMADGTVIHFIGVVEDMTERHEVDRMKKDFISVVSHELRTPLTSIRGALGLIAGGVYDKKPDKMKAMIDIAARQSDRLVRLVNDILDLRRLESGQALFNFKSWASADLIQQSVDGLRSQAEQSQISLTILPSTAFVWADADAIIQTLTNLLSNAIKFSPSGSTITLSAIPLQPQKASDPIAASTAVAYTLFSVKDQGRGIPSDRLETIFGQFQQVDASDSREKGGTGLGLAICRTIVQQHQGSIWVESELNKGSTFYFTLPSPPTEFDNR